jgi:hypothetical protein
MLKRALMRTFPHNTISLLSCTVLLVLASCQKDDESDAWRVVHLSGTLDTTMTLEDHTEIRVSNALNLVSTADPGLQILGEVRFVLDPGATLLLPSVAGVDGSSLYLMASGDSWEGVTLTAGENLSLPFLQVSDAVRGLTVNNGSSLDLERLTISNGYYGLTLVAADTSWIGYLDVSSCETGVHVQDGGMLTISGGEVRDCGTGVRNTTSSLVCRDLRFETCRINGLWTHLERVTDIQNCTFSENEDHLYIQNNRNLVFRHNDLQGLAGNGFAIHCVYAASETATCLDNNLTANDNGWYINHSQGALNLAGNWWGTTDSTAIHNGIYDSHVDFNRTGVATFWPPLAARVVGAGVR